MGQSVSFGGDGTAGDGWLATPAGGRGQAVVVTQEWWGLVPHVITPGRARPS